MESSGGWDSDTDEKITQIIKIKVDWPSNRLWWQNNNEKIPHKWTNVDPAAQLSNGITRRSHTHTQTMDGYRLLTTTTSNFTRSQSDNFFFFFFWVCCCYGNAAATRFFIADAQSSSSEPTNRIFFFFWKKKNISHGGHLNDMKKKDRSLFFFPLLNETWLRYNKTIRIYPVQKLNWSWSLTLGGR